LFYDLILEFTSDEEALVQIEGIEIMSEYITVFKKSIVERDYLP
jgi:hypothetical protein